MLFLLFSDCPIFPSRCCEIISTIEIISSGIEKQYQFVFIPSIIILDNNYSGESMNSPENSTKDQISEPNLLVSLGFSPSKIIDFNNFRDKISGRNRLTNFQFLKILIKLSILFGYKIKQGCIKHLTIFQ